MKKSIRLNSNVVGDILRSRTGREAAPQKFQGPLPDPSVAVVVDGKLIDSAERAGLHERTLHYTLATLNKGGLALVAFTDSSILDREFLNYFEPRPEPNNLIEAALRSAGLDGNFHTTARAELQGFWMWVDVDFRDDIKYVPQLWAHPDLRQFDDGRDEGDWNDVISSVSTRNAPTRVWADINFEGASLTFGSYEDVANLHLIGWGDRISSIMVGPRPGIG